MKSPCEAEKARIAAENRDKLPEVARIVAEFKDVFGADQVKLIWAQEAGHEVGKKPVDWSGS